MTTEESATKVRIKTDEQATKRRRKRPDTQSFKAKRKKLQQLKGDHQDVKSKDKDTEHSWSAVNIENEKELMSMGLASLEVLDEAELFITRPGKRKKTEAPKSIENKDDDTMITENLLEAATIVSDKDSSNKEATCSRISETDKKIKIDEKKEKIRMKRKERQAKLKLKRHENPDLEIEKLRKEKLKEKRKAKRAQKKHEKQLLALQSDLDKYIEDQKTTPAVIGEVPVNCTNSQVVSGDVSTPDKLEAQTDETSDSIVSVEQDETSEIVSVEKDEASEIVSVEKDEAFEIVSEEKDETSEIVSEEKDESSEIVSEEKDEASEIVSVEKDEASAIVSVEKDEASEIVSEEKDETSEIVSVEKDANVTTQKVIAPDHVANSAILLTNNTELDDGNNNAVLDVSPMEDPAVELTPEEKQKGVNWLELDVCEPIVKALLELGFSKPTPIQQACIPEGLLRYKDVIGAAETGSGKTLAFGIPLIQRVMKLKSDGCVKGLVLCPTRELALQVTEHLVAASKYTGVRIVPIVGGIAAPKQQRLLSYKPPILVATPGRLWQLIQEHEYLQDLASIKFLVVDEADRMVEDGHFEEVTQIVGRLPKPEQRNTFLFSATLAFTIDRLEEKAKKKKKTKQERRAEKRGTAGIELLVRNIGIREKVEKVDLTLKKGTAELLTETYFLCNVEDKDVYLYYLLLNHPGKTLVFANAIDGVMNLVHIMKLLELPVFPLHSSLQQRQRFKFLEKFKKCENAALICTDIAARGLDIPEVDTVVHYQLPSTREAYIHRSGRTARADNPGLSIAIVGPKDFKSYKKVASQMSEFPIELTRLRVLRPPLQHARKIFKIERLKTRPEKKEAKLVALAKEAGLEAEDKVETSPGTKREVKILKAQLKSLLSQPVLDPLNSVRYNTRKGAMQDLQTVSTFSLGVSALKHSSKKKK